MNTVQKFLVVVVVVALVWVGFYFLSYQRHLGEIKQLEEEYQAVLEDYESKKQVAESLTQFEAEVEQLRLELEKSLSQLPQKRNIPALVEEVYDVASSAGVRITRLTPGGEVVKGFYAEIILSMDLQGGYHNLAVFFDKLGKLNRIVNIANLSLSSPKVTERGVLLGATCNLITYRFVGGGEVAPPGPAKPQEAAKKPKKPQEAPKKPRGAAKKPSKGSVEEE